MQGKHDGWEWEETVRLVLCWKHTQKKDWKETTNQELSPGVNVLVATVEHLTHVLIGCQALFCFNSGTVHEPHPIGGAGVYGVDKVDSFVIFLDLVI